LTIQNAKYSHSVEHYKLLLDTDEMMTH